MTMIWRKETEKKKEKAFFCTSFVLDGIKKKKIAGGLE